MESFDGAMAMRNRKTATITAMAHGAIQSLPAKVWLVNPVEFKKSFKKRNRDGQKALAIRLAQNHYGIRLKPEEHHIADAIMIGRYYYRVSQI